MSRRSADWMTVSPSSTSIFRPSISTVGTDWLRRAEGAATERGVLLEFRAVLGDERAGRHGGGVGERADGVPHHVARDVEEEVDVAGRRGPLLESDDHLVRPPGPLAARRALPARLVVKEALEHHEGPHHADAVVHHHDARGPEERPGLLHR